MRISAAIIAAVSASAGLANAAIVQYSLSASTTDGSVVSGSFSYDTATVGANYYSESALADLLTFSVSISSIPGGGPASTTFSKPTDTSTLFVIQTDGSGAVVDFVPTFNANANSYSLIQGGFSTSLLMHPATAPFAADSITWSYAQVPEVGATGLAIGLGLLGFAGFRGWSRRR